MFDNLSHGRRLLMEVDLYPVQGDRFQPTGFADLGAAVYKTADGRRRLLVESAQSVANGLEGTVLRPDGELVEELEGLSYIRVELEGASEAKTNSLIEAHRLNSPFIISDKDFQKRFVEEANYAKGKPVDWRQAAAAIFRYDVNSLLHGVFLANVGDGRLRFSRAITGFIEAEDVQEAVSGGVKNNAIDPTGKIRAEGYDKDVYSNVPYARVEFTASRMTAFFNLDVQLLRSYGFEDSAFELLVGLALLKVRRFVDHGLRLRTACDLQARTPLRVTSPDGIQIPGEPELLQGIQKLIAASSSLFGNPPVTELKTKVKLKASKVSSSQDE